MYIIISFYSGEANQPEVQFLGKDTDAINAMSELIDTGRSVTVYKQDDGAVGAAHITHVCGKDLRPSA